MDKEKDFDQDDSESDYTGYSEKKTDLAVDLGLSVKPAKTNVVFSLPQKTTIVFQAQKNKSKIKTKFTS